MKRPTEAFRSNNLFELGCGYVVVSRFKADGRVEAGFFLLDVFCLGVKDSGFELFSSYEEFNSELIDRLFANDAQVRMTPESGRKLVEDAVIYARQLGFAPGADYKKASRVFGGISKSGCNEVFTFGKDGKPFYIQGTYESAAQCERILRALEARCGKDGFHYIVAADDLDPEVGAMDDDMADALEEMAVRMREESLELQCRISPPGCQISDMLAVVAEPLLKKSLHFEEKEIIMNLAALAWNYARLGLEAELEMEERTKRIIKEEYDLETFLQLAGRALQLYPDERRLIVRVEVEPETSGDFALRVASCLAPEEVVAGEHEETHPYAASV